MLRDYQKIAIDCLLSSFAHIKNPLLVAPTGAGKSHIIAGFIDRVLTLYPTTRFLMLTHRKELIEQNTLKMVALLKDKSLLGVYSAGLKVKDVQQITFAGVQSAYKNVGQFGHRDLVIIDEVHLVPKEGAGMYQTILAGLKAINPKMRICGLTATPYRTDSGMLYGASDSIFDGVAYEIKLPALIKAGHLTNLITQEDTRISLEGLTVRGGDYVMNEAAEKMEPTADLLNKIIKQTENRKSVLVFACNIAHCQELCNCLPNSVICTSETEATERARITKDFKEGKIKFLINCDLFTTGFDAPNIDAIVLVRPTKSMGLYVQMCGRGLRTFEGKKNCLILDFAGNIDRFGPLDCLEAEVRDGKARAKKAPTKKCPDCDSVIPLGVLECPNCGRVFTREQNKQIEAEASKAAILSKAESFGVDHYDFIVHNKEGKPPSLRVMYSFGSRTVSEFICPAHGGYATMKAMQWWKSRGGLEPFPSNAQEMLNRIDETLKPERITVIRDGKWFKILDVELKEAFDAEKSLGINI